MSIMTKTEYAKHRNVSQAAVSKMVREDRILVTPDGRIDSDVSDVLLNQFSESPLQNQARDSLLEQLGTVESYTEQRALLTKYKAGLAKIDLDKAAGTVVDAIHVRDVAHSTARRVRDHILNLPDRLAPLLAAETDTHAIRTLLDSELRSALEELHNEFIQEDIVH
jgi:hypothetical protein